MKMMLKIGLNAYRSATKFIFGTLIDEFDDPILDEFGDPITTVERG